MASPCASPAEPVEGWTPASLHRLPNAGDVRCEPLSDWRMTSSGLRVSSAMSSASSTTRVFRSLEKAQPTIRRDRASSTTARNSQPTMVGMKVLSTTRSWFGASEKKLRRTRSDVGLSARLDHVVRMLHLRLTPVI